MGTPQQLWSKRCCWRRRCQIWPLWMTQLHAKRKPSWPKQPRSSGSMTAIQIMVKHLLRWTRFWSGRRPSMARSWTWVCQTNAWSISECSAGGLGGASAGRCWSKLLAETPLYCATRRGPANLQHFVFFFGLGGSIFGAGMWPQKWVPLMFHACISLLNPVGRSHFWGQNLAPKICPHFQSISSLGIIFGDPIYNKALSFTSCSARAGHDILADHLLLPQQARGQGAAFYKSGWD